MWQLLCVSCLDVSREPVKNTEVVQVWQEKLHLLSVWDASWLGVADAEALGSSSSSWPPWMMLAIGNTEQEESGSRLQTRRLQLLCVAFINESDGSMLDSNHKLCPEIFWETAAKCWELSAESLWRVNFCCLPLPDCVIASQSWYWLCPVLISTGVILLVQYWTNGTSSINGPVVVWVHLLYFRSTGPKILDILLVYWHWTDTTSTTTDLTGLILLVQHQTDTGTTGPVLYVYYKYYWSSTGLILLVVLMVQHWIDTTSTICPVLD